MRYVLNEWYSRIFKLLKEPGLTGEMQQEYILIIEKVCSRTQYINDIVDISKLKLD
jgi:hypothetical protein